MPCGLRGQFDVSSFEPSPQPWTTLPCASNSRTGGAGAQQVAIGGFCTIDVSSSVSVSGRCVTQMWPRASTKTPVTAPRIQLFGSSSGHAGSTLKDGVPARGGPPSRVALWRPRASGPTASAISAATQRNAVEPAARPQTAIRGFCMAATIPRAFQPSSPAVRDELAQVLLQHRQRYRAQRQNRVVEAPLVERRAEFFLGLGAKPPDQQFAELVGERLSRPGDVAFDLGRDLVLGERRMLSQVVHRALTAPPELVDAGVDDEPGGAPRFVRQAPEVLVRSFVDPHQRAQPFG